MNTWEVLGMDDFGLAMVIAAIHADKNSLL